MISTNELSFFSVLSRASSLAEAARSLNISPSAVSQKLHALEGKLGVRLLERTQRRLCLTAEGQLLAVRGAGILTELDELTDTLNARREIVTGHLTVAASFGFGRRYVSSAMANMRKKHPCMKLSLMLFEDPVMPQLDSWDVLIHIGVLPDTSLTLHRLAPNRRILCCAPSYIERHHLPTRPEDLRKLDCCVLRENRSDESLWRFTSAEGELVSIRINPSLISNDGGVVRDWAVSGLGVIVRSEWDIADEIRSGKLIELLPDWRLPDADIVALTGPKSVRVARVTQFIEEMRDVLRLIPWRTV